MKTIIGWREWVSLPGLGIPHIKAKIDTGARTSALHAFEVHAFVDKGVKKVRFAIHPLQKRTDVVKRCEAEIIDQRWVSDSGGHKEKRYVILAQVSLGDMEWDIEMTLTNRDTMKFRMLLGRTALESSVLVDPEESYLFGKPVRTPKK
jgi:hypothetical protein